MKNRNPREQRAFAHSARANANADPTAESITAALKYDRVLSQGPKKSRTMGRYAFGGLDATHVAFVDWTAVSEKTHEGNVGGTIIPKELADAVHAEVAAKAKLMDDKRNYGRWTEALNYPDRWVAGTPEGRGVKHLDAIPLHDAIAFPAVTHDMDGSPRDVDPDKTALAAIVKSMRQK